MHIPRTNVLWIRNCSTYNEPMTALVRIAGGSCVCTHQMAALFSTK